MNKIVLTALAVIALFATGTAANAETSSVMCGSRADATATELAWLAGEYGPSNCPLLIPTPSVDGDVVFIADVTDENGHISYQIVTIDVARDGYMVSLWTPDEL